MVLTKVDIEETLRKVSKKINKGGNLKIIYFSTTQCG